jgi:anti-anti-sigma factor
MRNTPALRLRKTRRACFRSRRPLRYNAVSFSVKTRRSGDATIVDVEGRVVFGDECDRLRNEVREAISSAQSIILNLRDVPYIDSGGIGCLVGLFATARNQGKDLRFASGNDKVQHVLRITKLLPVVGMFPDEESAIASCRRKATA